MGEALPKLDETKLPKLDEKKPPTSGVSLIKGAALTGAALKGAAIKGAAQTKQRLLRLLKPGDPPPAGPSAPALPALPEPEAKPVGVPEPVSTTRVRSFSALALLLALMFFGYVGCTAYRAMTDSFVAPMILSPDNDLVVQNKVKLTDIEMERARTIAESESVDADLSAAEKGIVRLTELEAMASNALRWTRDVNKHAVTAGGAGLRALSQQRLVLGGMIAKQQRLAAKARANLEAGVISRADYAREVQSLDQMRLAFLENGRTRAQSELEVHQATLGEDSLNGQSDAPPMPEVLAAEDQLVRVELSLAQLQSQRTTKLAEKTSVSERLVKLDDLESQLRGRPLYQAIEQNLDIAFVPYTQLDGVAKGAEVYSCIWGFFGCSKVGTVAEVVPGEVIAPDPWGSPARGQYAVLELEDRSAAKAKSLRVRGGRMADAPARTSEIAMGPSS